MKTNYSVASVTSAALAAASTSLATVCAYSATMAEEGSCEQIAYITAVIGGASLAAGAVNAAINFPENGTCRQYAKIVLEGATLSGVVIGSLTLSFAVGVGANFSERLVRAYS